jgi:hypothetical protein
VTSCHGLSETEIFLVKGFSARLIPILASHSVLLGSEKAKEITAMDGGNAGVFAGKNQQPTQAGDTYRFGRAGR